MKIIDSQANNLFASCFNAKTIIALVKTASVSFQEMGFDHLMYHHIPHLGSHDYNVEKIFHIPKEHKNWLISTFPQYTIISPRDPFESVVLKSGRTIWISDLINDNSFQSTENQVFLTIMRDHFGQSLIVPIYGPRGSRGYFFLPSKNVQKMPDIREIAFIEHMCSFFHLCYSNLRAMSEERPRLTPREHEVLQLIPLGLSNREIASKLQISTHTVNGYVKQLFAKLAVTDRVLVSQRAFALDLIE